MGFVEVKCPNCGAGVNLDASREFGFCTYCGTKVVQEKIIVEHRGQVSVDGISTKENIRDRADGFLAQGDFMRATTYYNKVLDLDPQSSESYWKLLLCRLKVKNESQLLKRYGSVSSDQRIRLNAYQEFANAMQYGNDEERKKYASVLEQLNRMNAERVITKIKDKNILLIGAILLFSIIFMILFFAVGIGTSSPELFVVSLVIFLLAVGIISVIVLKDKSKLKKVMTREQYANFKYLDIYKKRK